MTEAQKTARVGSLSENGFTNRLWRHNVTEANVDVSDVLNPFYWSMLSNRFTVHDEIVIVFKQRELCLRVMVTDKDTNWVRVCPMGDVVDLSFDPEVNKKRIESVEKTTPKRKAKVEENDVKGGLRVDYVPTEGFRVIDVKAGKDLVSRLSTKESAYKAREDYLARIPEAVSI